MNAEDRFVVGGGESHPDKRHAVETTIDFTSSLIVMSFSS